MPTDQPSAPESAYNDYSARQSQYQSRHDRAALIAQRLQIALMAVIAFAFLAIFRILHNGVPAWPLLAALLATAFLTNRYLGIRNLRNRLGRLLHHYELALGRVTGAKTQSDHTGEEFRSPGHLYDRDLSILGHDSLFGLLATVRTGIGRLGLSRYLLNLPNGDSAPIEILERRGAIQELTQLNDLREQIALLGTSRFEEVAANFFDSWLNEEPPTFNRAIRPALYVTSSIFLILAFLGLAGFVPWEIVRPNMLAVLAIQSLIALSIRKQVVAILNSASRLSNPMAMFRDGLALLQAGSYSSTRLQFLQQASRTPGNAIPAIARVQRQFVVVDQRTKEWYLIPSLLLCLGTHAALSIATWKRAYAQSMKLWLATWGEFETLNALATYAYEHPANTYPEILSAAPAVFEASGLSHPLLPATAVSNDIALCAPSNPPSPTNRQTSFYLISGSNMAGKSTLLRTIGLNAVLAATGAPIRGTHARITPIQLGASLAIVDSLADGKSKFLAEVERLSKILALAREPSLPVLFLIDEIFSGTNSLDRRAAAEGILRQLIASGAIGALSTHDLTLTELAELPELHGLNLHMASPDPDDPLAFDYLLKPGINQTSNALAIVRMMGIEA